MNGSYAMGIGFILDCFLGDPYRLPHPVRWMGRLISFLTRHLHRKRIGEMPHAYERYQPGSRNPRAEFCWGILLPAIVLTVTGTVVWLLRYFTYGLSFAAGLITDGILFYYAIAPRSLYRESMAVCHALAPEENGQESVPGSPAGLEEARRRLSRIVGRDTENLTEEGIIRAAVETVAENTSDGVTAPMLYMAVGGPVLCFLYKAVNTMDSMVGYHNDTFEYFGKAAARMDDVWNYIPARLTAFVMLLPALLPASGKWQAKGECRYCQRQLQGNTRKTAATKKVTAQNNNCLNICENSNKTYNYAADNCANNSKNIENSVKVGEKMCYHLQKADIKQVLFIYRRDKRNHKSPNSAHTESVCAGILGIRLAGDASYFGKRVSKPWIGDDLRPPCRHDIRRVNLLMYETALIMLALLAVCRLMVVNW